LIREARTPSEFEALVALRRQIDPLTATTAADLAHFIAEADDSYSALSYEADSVGFAWVAAWPDEEYASGTFGVLPESRGRGHGTALLDGAAARFARLQLSVDDGPAVAAAAPPPPTGSGVELTDSALRPDLARKLHALFIEGNADIPGVLADEAPGLEAWLQSQQAPSRRPDFRVIALQRGDPVGYAQLHVYPWVGYHGFSTVARTHRRRGIARELKTELIRRAREIGLDRLITQSNVHNLPMRALNASLGYEETVELVVLRRPA